MSASYNFGDTPCPFCHLPIISHLLRDYEKLKKTLDTTDGIMILYGLIIIQICLRVPGRDEGA
jgi:hypothetical protein